MEPCCFFFLLCVALFERQETIVAFINFILTYFMKTKWQIDQFIEQYERFQETEPDLFTL